jgi:hypothetical protein
MFSNATPRANGDFGATDRICNSELTHKVFEYSTENAALGLRVPQKPYHSRESVLKKEIPGYDESSQQFSESA